MILALAIILCNTLLLLTIFIYKKFTYWKSCGIPYIGFIEYLTYLISTLFIPNHRLIEEMYRKKPKLYGFFLGYDPCLYVADPDLVREVLISNFNSFQSRFNIHHINTEPLWDGHVASVYGERWKHQRRLLSPILSKTKGLVAVAETLANSMLKDITDHISRTNCDIIEFEPFVDRYVLNAVASFGFGVKMNDQVFIDNAKGVFGEDYAHFIYTFFPSWKKILGCKILSRERTDYFAALMKTLLKQTTETNKDNYIIKTFSKTLNTNEGLTETELLANTIMLFFAAADTTTNVLKWTFYHFAKQIELQERVRSEVTNKENDLTQMRLTEACINETVRWGVSDPWLIRCCTADTIIGNVPVKRGTNVMIPKYGFHQDPKLFFEPQKYLPDRFLPENKWMLGPFLGFGDGPRICMGKRFGLILAKTAIAKVLQHFRIEQCDETPKTIELGPSLFLLKPKQPLLTKLVPLPDSVLV